MNCKPFGMDAGRALGLGAYLIQVTHLNALDDKLMFLPIIRMMNFRRGCFDMSMFLQIISVMSINLSHWQILTGCLETLSGASPYIFA